MSNIPPTIDKLNTIIDNNNFEIKNEVGLVTKTIRTVDVYNQVSNKEPFTPLRHINVPTMSDADEVLATFDNDW